MNSFFHFETHIFASPHYPIHLHFSLFFQKHDLKRSSIICTFSLSFHFCYFCYMYVLDISNFKASINNQNIYFQKFSRVFWFFIVCFHRSEGNIHTLLKIYPLPIKQFFIYCFYCLFIYSLLIKYKITIKLGRPFPTRSTTIDKSWRKTIFQL